MDPEARHFLETLFAGKPDALYILIWTLADKKSYWFQKVEDAIRFVESLRQQDVYVGTGLSPRDYGPGNRCKSDEIAGSVCVFIDIDLRSDAHPNSALPGTIEEALSILPPEFPPSFVILTGNGIHAWFLFREPYILQNEGERQSAAALAHRWSTLIRDNARMKGWKIERLKDLARLLRIPGTMNCKDAANPKSVVIHSMTDRRYDPTDLAEFLDEQGIPGDEAEDGAQQKWIAQFQDKPLKIDLDATIPQEQIDHWIASDQRFKHTWFRQRTDLKDHSQSGYDLALACFGSSVGLDAQRIVDLIVHHRRIHKEPPRTKLDYFSRTLSKAATRSQIRDPSAPPPEPVTSEDRMGAEAGAVSESPPSGQQPVSDREKIDLWKKLSGALGIDLLRIVKVSGDNPFYRMDLAEGSISFPTVGKLIGQAAVRTAIAGRAGRLIPQFKAPMWRMLAQMMLDACIVEDGGEELESSGAARLVIRQYLVATGFISSIEGQSQEDLRKPMVRDDQIAVCSSDLQTYVNKIRSPSISVQAAVAMLSAAGAKVERVRSSSNKFREQSRWMLPLDQFDPADYPSSVSGGSTGHA